MITVLVGVVIFILVLSLVIIVAREPGPSAGDVAVSYEAAWSRLDFKTLWVLSGEELRDRMSLDDYIVAKSAAYASTPSAQPPSTIEIVSLTIEDDYAVVHTSVALTVGSQATNEIELARRRGRWLVVAYRLISSGRTV
jgi:hypothetical protein